MTDRPTGGSPAGPRTADTPDTAFTRGYNLGFHHGRSGAVAAPPAPSGNPNMDWLEGYEEGVKRGRATADPPDRCTRCGHPAGCAERCCMNRAEPCVPAAPEVGADESALPLDEPTLTRILGELAPVIGGDLLEGGVKYRVGLASAIVAALNEGGSAPPEPER